MVDKLEKLQKLSEKPIYIVKIISLFIITDSYFCIATNENIFQFIKNFNKNTEKDYIHLLFILLSIFIAKIILGAISLKIFYDYSNTKIRNNNGVSKSLESWSQIAYKSNDKYAINRLDKIKQDIEIEKNMFLTVFINLVLYIFYLIFSKFNLKTLLNTIEIQRFANILLFIYLVIISILVLQPFRKDSHYFIELESSDSDYADSADN